MRRWLGGVLALLLMVTLGGDVPMAKQDVIVWLYYDSQWNNVTERVYTRDPITINHGAGNEQTGVVPSDASLTFDNRDGEMNPENRKSSLFGKIGHNTPIQIEVDGDTRFTGQVVSWKPRRAVKGDAWVHVEAQGTIRRLGQGEPPVESALYRTITKSITASPAEYWPLEAADGSARTARSVLASAVGGDPVSPNSMSLLDQTPTFAGFPGSGTSIQLLAADTNTMVLPVRPYTDTGFWAVQTAWLYTDEMQPDGTMLFDAYLSNGRQIHLFLDDDGAGSLTFTAAVTDDVTVFYNNFVSIGGDLIGQPISVMMSLSSAAGGTLVENLLDSEGSVVAELSTTGIGYGTVLRMEMTNVQPGASDQGGPLGVAHTVFYTDSSFDIDVDTVTMARAVGGFTGETAGERFDRLCIEEDIADTVVGSLSDSQVMGPQYPDTFLNWMQEIARTDTGIVHDSRDELGLTLRTGRSLYNQTPALTLDFEDSQIAESLEPDIDDFGRTNVVVAKRRNGGQATDSDDDGPLGTTAIGAYKTQVDINPETDDALPLHAGYHLILGTDPDPRYPQVVVDLDANPDLAASVAAVDIGDLIALQNLPEDLGAPSADVLVLGYTEVIGSHRRVITFNTRSGAILSHVGVLDGDNEACLQTAGAQLNASITAEAVSFAVATTSGAIFTTSPPTGAQIVVADREVMTVTAISGGSSPQTFTVTRDPLQRVAHASGASVKVYRPIRLTL